MTGVVGGKEWGVTRDGGSFWGDESVWEITTPNELSLNYLLKKVKFGYVNFNSIKTERSPRSCLGTVATLTMRAAGGLG